MSARITFLGHASFQLTLPDERVILIDPWLTDNPACPDHLKKPTRCDLIVLTHGHDDHVGDVGNLIDAHHPKIVGNFDLCGAIQARIGKGDFRSMGTGGTQTIDGVRVTLTQAFHSSGLSSPTGPVYAGMPNGVILDVDGLAKVYHAGDTDVFSDMKLIARLFAPEIAILPIGDYFTMGAKGAALAVEFLQPKAIVPCHFGTFPVLARNAAEFKSELSSDFTSRVVEPKIGEPIAWTADGIGADE